MPEYLRKPALANSKSRKMRAKCLRGQTQSAQRGLLFFDRLGPWLAQFARRTLCDVLVSIGLSLPAQAWEKFGIVLMHGRDRLPGHMARLTNTLASAVFKVQRPEMCWSRRRIYYRSYLDCLHDIDDAVESLKSAGITEIVIAGVGSAAMWPWRTAHEGAASRLLSPLVPRLQ
jgi:hypothetical protein